MLDVFKTSAFSTTSLTKAINVVPNMYGRINQLNLMPSKGVATTSITIEINNGVLNLLPAKERGQAASKGVAGKREMLSFVIPHIPHEDVVKADDVQNIRAFGSENRLQGVLEVVNTKLAAMRNKHSITLEHLRVGALNGVILDATGAIIYDLFNEFGITQKEVNFNFGGAANVPAACRDVVRHIEDNLMGDMMTGVRALCSPEFFDALVSDSKVEDAYKYFESTSNLHRDDVRKGFKYQGITFEEYRGKATYLENDGTTTTRNFIAAGDARFFPEGTQETFETNFGPADFIEAVNTIGLEIYAKQKPSEWDKGIDIHSQSNPLPLCTRPATLVRGKSAS